MIDAADVQFLLTKVFFRDLTKEKNDEMAELEKLNHEHEYDRWCRLIASLYLHHCVLEGVVLSACKDAHELADCEGIGGRISASRKKTFLKFALTITTTQVPIHVLVRVWIFMMIF